VSQITELASAAITATDTITVELIEADETLRSRHRQMVHQADRHTSIPPRDRRRCCGPYVRGRRREVGSDPTGQATVILECLLAEAHGKEYLLSAKVGCLT
jgi:hypothetical protein